MYYKTLHVHQLTYFFVLFIDPVRLQLDPGLLLFRPVIPETANIPNVYIQRAADSFKDIQPDMIAFLERTECAITDACQLAQVTRLKLFPGYNLPELLVADHTASPAALSRKSISQKQRAEKPYLLLLIHFSCRNGHFTGTANSAVSPAC